MRPQAVSRRSIATLTLPPAFERPTTSDPLDPVERLGSALDAFSSDVSRREEQLNLLVKQISTERNQLLDAVLNRLFEGFAGFIPFDQIICSFLGDMGKTAVAYWMRSNEDTIAVPVGHTAPIMDSGLYEAVVGDQPRIIDDLPAFVATRPGSDLLQRLAAAGARSSLTCPLVADGQPLGFLLFTSREQGVYQPGHVTAFQRLARQVSVVVQKTRTYGRGLTHGRRMLAEHRRLRQAVTTDPLTGVLNRRGLDQALTRAWRRYANGQSLFSVILCDIDRFKQVNDTYGHAVGDRVLSEAARRLARGLRTNDVFGRYGGEEFLAIVDTAHAPRVVEVAERLRSLMSRAPFGGIRVSASFGAAVVDGFTSLHGLFIAVDRALYAAKAQGRDRCVLAEGAPLAC